MNFPSGFITDLSYIKFTLIVFNSGEYHNDENNKISENIKKEIENIQNQYTKIIAHLSRKELKKVDDKTNKILHYFIKKTTAARDIDNVAVEVFAAFILKYRFSWFRKKPINKILDAITNKTYIINLIKNISLTIKEDRKITTEIHLARDIAKAF